MKYDLVFDNVLQFKDTHRGIALYKIADGTYFFWQTQQNGDEPVFYEDELREFCENILEILDGRK